MLNARDVHVTQGQERCQSKRLPGYQSEGWVNLRGIRETDKIYTRDPGNLRKIPEFGINTFDRIIQCSGRGILISKTQENSEANRFKSIILMTFLIRLTVYCK